MLNLVKLVVILVIAAIVVQQATLYYSFVFTGSYMSVAPMHLKIMTAVVWPIVVVAGALFLCWKIVKFKPSDLG